MRLPENRNDLFTVAAVGVLAMCVVTFDHEALGHGKRLCFPTLAHPTFEFISLPL
jgi:hypothetical protein